MINVAAKTIEYIANQRGILFSGSTDLLTGTEGGRLNSAIVTGDTPIMLVSRYLRFTSAGLIANIYSDSTLTFLGEALPLQCLNMNAPRPQSFSVYAVDQVTVQGTTKAFPTLSLATNSQGHSGGGEVIRNEALIIPPNSTYHLAIDSIDAQQYSSTITIIDAGSV
jgi:hypothetical protein